MGLGCLLAGGDLMRRRVGFVGLLVEWRVIEGRLVLGL